MYVSMQPGSFHTGTLKRTVTVMAPARQAWNVLGDIAGMTKWAAGVQDVAYMSERKRGIGAVRLITFANGDKVEEHVVAWTNGEQFTYVATAGLPLRAYVATISLDPVSAKKTRITWKSYMNSQCMQEQEFLEFVASMGSFYEESLGRLKGLLEG